MSEKRELLAFHIPKLNRRTFLSYVFLCLYYGLITVGGPLLFKRLGWIKPPAYIDFASQPPKDFHPAMLRAKFTLTYRVTAMLPRTSISYLTLSSKGANLRVETRRSANRNNSPDLVLLATHGRFYALTPNAGRSEVKLSVSKRLELSPLIPFIGCDLPCIPVRIIPSGDLLKQGDSFEESAQVLVSEWPAHYLPGSLSVKTIGQIRTVRKLSVGAGNPPEEVWTLSAYFFLKGFPIAKKIAQTNFDHAERANSVDGNTRYELVASSAEPMADVDFDPEQLVGVGDRVVYKLADGRPPISFTYRKGTPLKTQAEKATH